MNSALEILLIPFAAVVLSIALVVGLYFCLYSRQFRVWFVLLGTLFLFQTDAVPGTVKLLFVLGTVVFGLISLRSVLTSRGTLLPALARAMKWCLVAAGLMLIVAIGGILSIAWTNVPSELLVRDAINYILPPFVLIVGLDAGLNVPFRRLAMAAVTVGILGAVSTAAAWLERRGGETLGIDQFGLASSYLVYGGVAACFGLYFGVANGKSRWLLLGFLQIGIVIAAGGRQAILIFALAVATAVLFASGSILQKARKTLGLALAAVIGMFGIVAFSSSFGGNVAIDRFNFFGRILDNGLEAVQSDGSAVHRSYAYTWMIETWQANPLIGQGLGQSLPSVRTGQVTYGLMTLDTPFVVLAKFGVFGTIPLIAALCIVFVAVWRLGRGGNGFMKTATAVSFVCLVASVPNGFPHENRGFSPFLLLLIALAFSSAQFYRSCNVQAVEGGSENSSSTAGLEPSTPL